MALIAFNVEILAVAVVLSIVWWLVLNVLRSREPENVVPMLDGGFPFLGHALELAQDSQRFAKRLFKPGADVTRINLAGREMVVLRGAEMERFYFSKGAEAILDQPKLALLTGMNFMFGDEFLSNLWQARLLTHYLNPRLEAGLYVDNFEKFVSKHLDEAYPDPVSTITNMQKFGMHCVRECTLRLFCGSQACDNAELKHSFETLYIDTDAVIEISVSLGRWAGWLRSLSFRRHTRIFTKVLTPILEERIKKFGRLNGLKPVERDPETKIAIIENDGRPDDLLQASLDVVDKYGNPPSIDDIINRMMVNAFASMSTTNNQLYHVIWNLVAYPEYQETLRQEQREIIQELGTTITDAAIKKMKALGAFMRESFRTTGGNAVGPNLRYVKEDGVLPNGQVVKAGSFMAMSIYAYHHNESVYPDPGQFKPDRYLVEPEAVKANTSAIIHANLVSFNGGSHACPGRFLATKEILLISALLLRKFRLSVPPEKLEEARKTHFIGVSQLRCNTPVTLTRITV